MMGSTFVNGNSIRVTLAEIILARDGNDITTDGNGIAAAQNDMAWEGSDFTTDWKLWTL